MASVVLILRVLLIVVFAAASLAKLTDLEASSDTVEAFGVPGRLAAVAGRALPVAELAVAAALLPLPSARWGALGAAVLLLVFSGGVAYALSQGRTPNCNCFGQVSSEQISWRTLARNAVLVVVAVFAAVEAPGASLRGWTHSLEAANIVSSVAVLAALLLAVVAYALSKRPVGAAGSSASAAPEGMLAPGAVAPDFELPNLAGELTSRDALLARGLPLVLVFASPTCAPCRQLLPELVRWNGAMGDDITLVVIESGVSDSASIAEQIEAAGGIETLIESDDAVAQAYFVPGTPTGIGISPDGLIASPPLPGRHDIEHLIRTVLRTGGAVPQSSGEQRQPVRS